MIMETTTKARFSFPIKRAVEFASAVAMIAASGVVVWAVMRAQNQPAPQPRAAAAPAVTRTAPPIPAQPLALAGAAVIGNRSSSVAIIEFSDFQCPFCARFVKDTLPQLMTEYVNSGRVLLAFRQHPLEQPHPLAFAAAQTSLCAGRSGKFWPTHDLFFQKSAELRSADAYTQVAVAAGVPSKDLKACLADKRSADQVRQDIALADQLQTRSTPAFFIGLSDGQVVHVTSVINGAQSLKIFQEKLNEALTKPR
jgi:protein-disulfide isomerase